jgi:hypothetical protein
LNNISAGTITNIYIAGNTLLSSCDATSICNYLSSPNGEIIIQENAPGCNSQQEVEAACNQVSTESIGFDDEILLFPNPAGKTVTISGNKGTTIREIVIYNQTGQKVLQGKPVNNTLGISNLRPGLYILELLTDQWKMRKKLMVE